MMFTVAMLLATLTSPVAPVSGDTMCVKQTPGGSTLPDKVRQKSPFDSVSFKVGGKPVKICYSRPSLRGRKMVVGDQNPWGEVWRTGANEPTIIYTPVALTIAGIKVPAGKYSLYTIPQEKGDWTVIINKGTDQWGLDYDSVQDQDVGRGKAKNEATTKPVEQFTIRPDTADAKEILLEWQTFRVHIPVSAN
jgi:hypothetical protein